MVALSEMLRAERFDAQFFRKAYLVEDQALNRHELEHLGSHAKVTDGPHGYHEVDESSAIAMLTARSAAKWFATRDGADCISIKTHQSNLRSALAERDVILGTRGTVGRCALVLSDVLPANIDQDVARITIDGGAPFSPEYIVAYLNGRFGQDHIERHSTGMVQQGINLTKVRAIPIPILSSELQAKVGEIVREARARQMRSQENFAKAEALLLDALGLRRWSPPEPLTYTRSAAAVAEAGRLDAQYFMPAKLEMLHALGDLPGGLLGESFASIRDMVDPNKGNPETVVRNYDLTDALQPVLDATSEPKTYAVIDSQKKRLRKGDLAVSRLRAYLKEIAVVQATDDIPAIGSSEFYVLRRNAPSVAVSAEALMVYLKSAPVQTILKWCQDGSQHPRFAERDLMAIPLPDVVAEKNDELTAKVRTAFASRARSFALLEAAKRGVEIAIEEGEAAALAFIAEMEGAHAATD